MLAYSKKDDGPTSLPKSCVEYYVLTLKLLFKKYGLFIHTSFPFRIQTRQKPSFWIVAENITPKDTIKMIYRYTQRFSLSI